MEAAETAIECTADGNRFKEDDVVALSVVFVVVVVVVVDVEDTPAAVACSLAHVNIDTNMAAVFGSFVILAATMRGQSSEFEMGTPS